MWIWLEYMFRLGVSAYSMVQIKMTQSSVYLHDTICMVQYVYLDLVQYVYSLCTCSY